ncbi:MAG TPA: Spy/CpxP family protein refolding chaperone [Ignavibacteriales bacterium]|nr:Spy/CpxP family protein refolding chaperone [Ignavibacteriales bacterium]HOL80869.1 Spy/CpxP family protein refolding chaperone [Ignavibacteriales bacterium]HOM65895.1 Spy/CpxP family protein refolding chaperone [Ignavibacteriales bacterium]HPD67651.1 Spy/CpxP family protein refolding chaperone [Ignavibacteriales bacterium]HPP33304.1 Spy/CpxP family protein refolding chaperone [Ignavibacteriales bacterium]
MKPKVSTIVLAIIAVFIFSSATIFAQTGPGRMKGNGKGFGSGYCLNNLSLTSEQKAEIEKLIQQHQAQMIDYRAQIEKINLQIADERNKQNPDYNKIKQLINQRNDVKSKMDMARVDHQQQVYSKLTDEQKKQMYQNRPIGTGLGKGKGFRGNCPYMK